MLMSKLTPTSEQQSIIDAAKLGKSMSIKALAGTGKTTTLAMICNELVDRDIIYLAFNKAIVNDAEKMMPVNVVVKTFHSLAYREVRPNNARLQQRMSGAFIASTLKIKPTKIQNREFTAATIGLLVLETVRRFCLSADPELSLKHCTRHAISTLVELPPVITDDDVEPLRKRVLKYAADIWQRQTDQESDFPITHDTYVKMWALNNPVIEHNVILFDEAQDASPVFIDIVSRQTHAQVIWVGDPYQQIYAWRGAVDAFDRIRVEHELYLTNSYRFGGNIAALGTMVLQLFDQDKKIVGLGGKSKNNSSVILCRTNAGAIEHYMQAIKENKSVQLIGASDMVNLLNDIKSVRQGKPRGSFSLFKNWQELVEFSKSNRDGSRDVAIVMRFVAQYGLDSYLKNLTVQLTRLLQMLLFVLFTDLKVENGIL